MTHPKKSLGQHFLTNKQVVRALIEAAEVTKEDIVLEIGAGTGVVTKELTKRAKKVIAVEFDRDLIPTLKLELDLKGLENPNIQIISGDILKLDLKGLGKGLENIKIVGSIPYQITSPLIHKLITEGGWQVATLLIQKEVAEKITARPPKASYLSNFVQMFTSVELVRIVPKTAFWPRPKVDGAIIKIQNLGLKNAGVGPRKWSGFLHRGFAHPRKMLNKSFPRDILEKAGIDPTRRPQELTIKDWLNLFKSLKVQGV